MSGDGTPGAAVLNGVRNALARLPQSDVPEDQQEAVRRHLQAHLDDAERSARREYVEKDWVAGLVLDIFDGVVEDLGDALRAIKEAEPAAVAAVEQREDADLTERRDPPVIEVAEVETDPDLDTDMDTAAAILERLGF